MAHSDSECSNDGEIFSEDEIEPDDLFNDEAAEDGGDKKSDHEDDDEKPAEKPKLESQEIKKPKRIVKNPRKTLNFESLRGNNGLSALKKLFKDFQFKGNGYEKEDLTRVMTILQQWMSYQLCPSYTFESCMLQLENLGRKKVVQTLMKKYRSGMDDWGESQSVVKQTEDDDNMDTIERDEFDILLDAEIANARSDGEFSEDEIQNRNEIQEMPQNEEVTLTPEQLERIAKNRKMAEERKLKRMSQQYSSEVSQQHSGQIENQNVPESGLIDCS